MEMSEQSKPKKNNSKGRMYRVPRDSGNNPLALTNSMAPTDGVELRYILSHSNFVTSILMRRNELSG